MNLHLHVDLTVLCVCVRAALITSLLASRASLQPMKTLSQNSELSWPRTQPQLCDFNCQRTPVKEDTRPRNSKYVRASNFQDTYANL